MLQPMITCSGYKLKSKQKEQDGLSHAFNINKKHQQMDYTCKFISTKHARALVRKYENKLAERNKKYSPYSLWALTS